VVGGWLVVVAAKGSIFAGSCFSPDLGKKSVNRGVVMACTPMMPEPARRG
jgi:hypothetical protein